MWRCVQKARPKSNGLCRDLDVGLESGFQPLLTLGGISHSTSLGSNVLTSTMGSHMIGGD